MTGWARLISYRCSFWAISVAAALLGLASGPTFAEQITLKLHHFVPAQSNQQKYWFEPWAKKLEQDSGGRIKVEIYPSMQLASG